MFSSNSFSSTSFSTTSFSMTGLVVPPTIEVIIGNIMQTIGVLTQSGTATIIPTPVLPKVRSDILGSLPGDVAQVTTGDDLRILLELTRRGIKFYIPSTATVTCRLLSIDRSKAYTAEVVQVSTQSQADWVNSLLSIDIPANITEAIKATNPVWVRGLVPAILETQVLDGIKETYFSNVLIGLGTVI